jgi:uncharacterized protein YjiS (DUF1127 family)
MHAMCGRSFMITMVLWVSHALSVGARHMHTLAASMNRRRHAREAVQQLSTMSDRELKDLGIARSEIERIVWEPPRLRGRLWQRVKNGCHSTSRSNRPQS